MYHWREMYKECTLGFVSLLHVSASFGGIMCLLVIKYPIGIRKINCDPAEDCYQCSP